MDLEKLTGVPGEVPIEIQVSGSERFGRALFQMFEAMDLESLEFKEFPETGERISTRIKKPGRWKMTVKFEKFE